ncbi:uncharacterized protein G2W53_009856 [Senna tora]|uniref:Uncharacterized protein n=1 Tax=Senna tora TaxID=362788 RepID=A0A834WYP6_9FABA|nr:uncharacterized protein G2W53_009856 [Senna tora]
MRQKTCCASESNTSVRVVFANRSGFDAPIGVVVTREEHGSCLNIFRTTNRGWISETFTNYEAKDLLRKCVKLVGRSVEHVLPYFGRQIALGSQKPSRIMRQKTCCASQTRRFALYSRTGVVLMLRLESSWHGRTLDHVLTFSGRQIADGSQKPSRITWQKTRCESQSNTSKTSPITRQKTCCASESNTSVRVEFANRSGVDAPIEVVLAWEERGSCLNIFRMTNRGRISETFMNNEAKDLLRKNLHELRGKRLVAQVSQTRRFANESGFDAPIGVVLAWEERGSCLNIFRTTNRGRISETFTNYEAKDLLRKSQKPSRITRQKTCCASESNTSVRVVFANGSGFHAPIGVVLAWEERGSCLNIFRTTNRHQISKTFTNYEAKDLLRKQKTCCASESNTSVSVGFANGSGFDAPIGVILAWDERGSCLNIFQTTNRDWISETFTNYEAKDLLRINLHELRGKRLVAQVSQTRRFANGSGFEALIGVVLAWEECGSCLNIFQTTNHGRMSETYTNYEAKDLFRKNHQQLRGKRIVAHVSQTRRFALYSRTKVVLMLRLELSWRGRSVDHVLTYSERQITVGSQKPSQIARQKTCCANDKLRSDLRNLHELRRKRLVAQVSQTRRFENRSGFDAPIGVVVAWEERGSCLNIFRTTNRGRISETFTNNEAKDLLRKRVKHVGSRCIRERECESNTSVRVVFANRSGFDASIGVVLAWEERGSCLNIFRMTNRVGSQSPSRITREKTRRASESNTSVRVVLANGSGFDAPIGVVLAWKQRGSCHNIFRTTNREKPRSDLVNLHELRGKRLVAQVSQTRRFALYSRTGVVLMLRLESSWHGRSVDHVLTYSGRQIALGSQKPSQITRLKTCCASESNTSVRVAFANRSGFDAPIEVVLAWEERGSCLNIFRTTNRGRISETFTNYEAKDLLRK